MLGRWLSKRERKPEILVVSEDAALVARVTSMIGNDVTIMHEADPGEAIALLASRPFFGAVVDAALPGRNANAVARAFLGHQPVGHVAMIGSADDPTTLVALAMRDRRVELIYKPIVAEVLVGFLLPHRAESLVAADS